MGYRFQAQSESSQSHCIPIGFDQANSDYRQIMKAIEQFVYKKGADKSLLMFAKVRSIDEGVVNFLLLIVCVCMFQSSQAEAVDRIEWCLQWLADKAGMYWLIMCVCSLEVEPCFFFSLMFFNCHV